MNDYELDKVFVDIDIVYRNFKELNLVYKLGGKYLWINCESGIVRGYDKFSLRNLDKLLKMIKKNNVEFNKFEIQY